MPLHIFISFITNLLLTYYNEFVIIVLDERGIIQMFHIEFYQDSHGREPMKEYIEELHAKATTSKDSRINFTKIMAYIDVLEKYGTRVGEPVTKHLDGEIWELRPLDNRILYAYWKDNTFILLHHFIKKSNKTPVRDLEQAKRNLKDYLERNGE